MAEIAVHEIDRTQPTPWGRRTFRVVLTPAGAETAIAVENIAMPDSVAASMRAAAGIHLWNNMISRANLDKDVLPPDGSLLYNLYDWTIGTSGFRSQYVLDPDSPPDE